MTCAPTVSCGLSPRCQMLLINSHTCSQKHKADANSFFKKMANFWKHLFKSSLGMLVHD